MKGREVVRVLLEEVESKVEKSYTMQTDHNIYLTAEDWDRSQGAQHVSNRRLDTKVAALACDLLAEEGPLKVLFRSDSFLSAESWDLLHSKQVPFLEYTGILTGVRPSFSSNIQEATFLPLLAE